MTTVNDILKVLFDFAPKSLALDYDNPGFLVGCGGREVKKILVALDITSDVICEAKETGAELIVSHHPIIFSGEKSITDNTVTGSLVLSMAEAKLAAICMHTNLDSAKGGVNDILADLFEIENAAPLDPVEDGTVGIGRYGVRRSEMQLSEFLKLVCDVLSCEGVRFHDAGKPVRKLAVGGGSCGDYITAAKSLGCDTIVTADIKHNQFLDARELSINAIDAGHFATENIVCEKLCEIIRESFPSLSVSQAKSNTDAVKYFKISERKS